MAAIAPLVLLDGQTTPVSHTFAPVNIMNDVARWADRAGGISVGFPEVTHSLRGPTKGSRAYKLQTKVVMPVLEVSAPGTSTGFQPAPTKAYDLIASVEIIMPERSTLAQRKDILAYCKNVLASAVVTAAVADFESVY